jgi:transcription termination/antitermination protein NusG
MEIELTGRSCIQGTATGPIIIDVGASSPEPNTVQNPQLWYAGYTASRHEKRVAEHFAQRGVEHFLPLYETIHRWNNGRHRVQLPLFPGYIFVRIALRDRLRVIEVPGFVRLVGFNSLPHPLPEADINRMKDALNKGVLAEPYPYLTVGTRVEIRNGPMQGMTGILLRRQNKCRVVISVDLIMRSMAVEVEAADVVPIRKSAFNIGQDAPGGKTTEKQAQI